jgi:hypothetical protein
MPYKILMIALFYLPSVFLQIDTFYFWYGSLNHLLRDLIMIL